MAKYRERLTECANHLDLPVLLVRGGLSDVLSEEGALPELVEGALCIGSCANATG